MSEVSIRRLDNGWILTQYNHDDDDVVGPLSTVHEDPATHSDPRANEAESLANLFYEAFPGLMFMKHQAGLEIVVHSGGRETQELETERDNSEPDFLLPQVVGPDPSFARALAADWGRSADDVSGICDGCGQHRENLSVVKTSNLSGITMCGGCGEPKKDIFGDDGEMFIAWRYGQIKVDEGDNGEPIYQLSEVYIDEDGEAHSWCEATPNDIESLKMALNDLENHKPITKFYETGTFEWVSPNIDYTKDTGWVWTENKGEEDE